MAARSLMVYTLILPNPEWSDGAGQPYRVDPNTSYISRLDRGLTTLSKNSANGGDTIQGLLYTPELPATSTCYAASTSFNSTRKQDLPSQDFHLIALAPWLSAQCGHEYLQAASHDPVQAFLFFLSGSGDGQPPSLSANNWGLEGKWTDDQLFPVYAIPPARGTELIHELGLYSGNMTDVPFGHNLTETYKDSRDYVRLHAQIGTRRNTSLPGLWVFLLVVLGALMAVIIITSVLMHYIQRRRRQALMRRVASGEVDLEALGIKRITVPQSRLNEFPLFVYPAQDDKSKDLSGLRQVEGTDQLTETPSGSTPVAIPVVTIDSKDSTVPIKLSTLRPDTQDLSSGACKAPELSSSLPHCLLPFTQPTCPICLDDFVSDETTVRELPCRHIFHPECVDTFLTENSSLCPMCKANMLPKGFCPANVTNAMVRRERVMRRVRERVRANGDESTAGLPLQSRAVRLLYFWRRVDPGQNAVVELESTGAGDAPTSGGEEPARLETQGRRERARARTAVLLGRGPTQAEASPEEGTRPASWRKTARAMFSSWL